MTEHHRFRTVSRVITGLPATDGAGVELTRVIGQPALNMHDPFLLLDAFRSDNPDEYLAGFPSHPHRGFETVTYLLAGRMRHKDNAGHEGVIKPGGVQWMTAGKGIIHSEMPEQENGLLEGFQLWVNLPSAHKMDSPAYQEFSADKIPLETREKGVTIRVLSGETSRGTAGPVTQPLTEPVYLDVDIPAGAEFIEQLPESHNAFVYIIQGRVKMKNTNAQTIELKRDDLGLLTLGDNIKLEAKEEGARLLLIAGKPLNEPVARGGPFVMNTQTEIKRAFQDYEQGLM